MIRTHQVLILMLGSSLVSCPSVARIWRGGYNAIGWVPSFGKSPRLLEARNKPGRRKRVFFFVFCFLLSAFCFHFPFPTSTHPDRTIWPMIYMAWVLSRLCQGVCVGWGGFSPISGWYPRILFVPRANLYKPIGFVVVVVWGQLLKCTWFGLKTKTTKLEGNKLSRQMGKWRLLHGGFTDWIQVDDLGQFIEELIWSRFANN